jgi:hypothetical protein
LRHDEPVNKLVLIIAPNEFGIGPLDGLEPIIDGVSLVDIMKRADGEVWHAGITAIEPALARLRAAPIGSETTIAQVLGCGCGDDGCSGVTVTISASDGEIIWSGIRASSTPAGPPGPRTYRDVGPFVFAREQYLSAVRQPVRAEQPLREQPDIAALGAGIPRDHAGWLRAMTMAFGRDFLTPREPELPRSVALSGLRAFANAGNPLPQSAVRAWATERRFTDDAIERYVGWFHDLAKQAQTP